MLKQQTISTRLDKPLAESVIAFCEKHNIQPSTFFRDLIGEFFKEDKPNIERINEMSKNYSDDFKGKIDRIITLKKQIEVLEDKQSSGGLFSILGLDDDDDAIDVAIERCELELEQLTEELRKENEKIKKSIEAEKEIAEED